VAINAALPLESASPASRFRLWSRGLHCASQHNFSKNGQSADELL